MVFVIHDYFSIVTLLMKWCITSTKIIQIFEINISIIETSIGTTKTSAKDNETMKIVLNCGVGGYLHANLTYGGQSK